MDYVPEDEIIQIQNELIAFQSNIMYLREAPSTEGQRREMFKNYLKGEEDRPGSKDLTRAKGYNPATKRHHTYNVRRADNTVETRDTIGFGSRVDPSESFAAGMTGDQIDARLSKDMDTARDTAKGRYGKGYDKLPARQRYMLEDYAFTGTQGPALTRKIKAGASDADIIKEATNVQHSGRTEGRKKLYADLMKLDNVNRADSLKHLLKVHVDFMEKYAVKSFEKHGIPPEYGEKIKDQQIETAKKFDKKDISLGDLAKFNSLVARQLGNLGLRDVR